MGREVYSNGGKPPLYQTPEEMLEKVEEYFQRIKGGRFDTGQIVINEDGDMEKVYENVPKEPATITGLCLFLGFKSRQSFYDHAKIKNFEPVIEYAKLRIENRYEVALMESKNPTGAIFVLKNMGWRDRVEQVIEDKSDNKTFTVKVVKK